MGRTVPNGIVTLLDAPHDAAVRGLWDEFQTRFGLQGVPLTPFPHFSYHVAEQYDIPRLRETIASYAAQLTSFTVQTNGLALFTGAQPVLYIPLVSTQALLDFQADVWRICETCVIAGSYPYYKPGGWVPHITIAQTDVQPQHIPELMRLLCERNFSWNIRVDNLSFLVNRHDGQPHQLEETYHLEGIR
jgi:2'-5' RNA ligase